MGYWGKIFGGMAGFAMGGPPGALMGAALGHAADKGGVKFLARSGLLDAASYHPARLASLFAPREQVFALAVIALSAKLAKCDGPVTRQEIEAFKRHFRIPPQSMTEVGRLFDQSRESTEDFEIYARQLGESYADARGTLEDVLHGLFGIARADGPVNQKELDFLGRVARGFRLDSAAWDRARTGAARPQGASPRPGEPDPYAVLGILRTASDEDVRAAWKRLMRENHPDSLAARGVPKEFIARATEKVANINAAWDRVKRERGL